MSSDAFDDAPPPRIRHIDRRVTAPVVEAKAGFFSRLFKRNGSSGNGTHPEERKAFPLSGVQWVGGAGPFSNASLNWLNGSGSNAEALDRATAFAASAYCYTAMLWRMEHVAEPPLMVVLETEEGQEWQPEHELTEIFDTPRPDVEMGEIVARTIGYRDLTGESIWHIGRDLAGRRRTITPFSKLEFKSEASNGLIFGRYWILQNGTTWKEVPREDVIHFRDTNPFSWRSCTSRVDVALAQLNLSHTVQRITKNFLTQAMFPGGVLSPDKDWHPTPEEWEQWKATVEAWQAGPANAGIPLALQGGTTFDRTASGMSDLLPDAVLDRVEATVGSVFGTPPVVLGWLTGLKNSPWSQMSEARRQAIEDTIQPLWTDVGKRATRGLLTKDERAKGLMIVFDTSQVRSLATDEERDARIAATNASLWTVDEGRLYTGMDKLPDNDPRGSMIPGLPFAEPAMSLGAGDETAPAAPKPADEEQPAAAVPTGGASLSETALNGAQVASLIEIVVSVTTGNLPLSAGVAMVRAAFPSLSDQLVADIFEDVVEGSATPEEPAPPAEGANSDPQPVSVANAPAPDTRDLLWLLFDLHTKANESAWTRAIGSYLAELQREIISAAQSELGGKSGMGLTEDECKFLLGLDEYKKVPGWINRTISKSKPKLVAKVYPLILKTGGTGVRRLATRLKISFSVLQPGLLKYARRESAFLAEAMGKTTGAAVARVVQESLIAGETIAALSKRLESLAAFDKPRAMLVARTETTRAWNGAQRASLSRYQETSGAKVFKSWLSARDDRVRDEHVELDDGTEIPVDDTFANGLSEPGEPNCRCSLTYRVADPDEGDTVVREPSEETQ